MNVSTIKNVQVGKQVSLEEIRGRTDRQENEISEIFVDHKARMVDVKRRNLLAMERGERGVLAEKNIDQNGRNGVHFGLEEHSETRQYSNLGQESTIGQ